jgi:Papain family cysteine protease
LCFGDLRHLTLLIVLCVQWGTGWGENGFVRIQREKGGHGRPGQCGIARSPSVALGGVLLDHIVLPSTSTTSNSEEGPFYDEASTPVVLEPVAPYTLLEELCLRTGQSLDAGPCEAWAHWTATHKAWWLGILGLTGTLLGVVWPLTGECRRRRAHRRRRRQLLLAAALHDKEEERDPLLHDEKSTTYGTNGFNDHHPTSSETNT